MTDVFVTNHSDKDITAEYCFQSYVFPVGKTVKLSVPAAKHMLGYGDENKEPYLVCLGLMRLHSELEEATEKFRKVEFSDTPPSKNRSLPSAVGVVPLRLEKAAGGKATQRAA